MAIVVNIDRYKAEHKQKPAGIAYWAFADHSKSTFSVFASYNDAVSQAKTWYKDLHKTSFGYLTLEA